MTDIKEVWEDAPFLPVVRVRGHPLRMVQRGFKRRRRSLMGHASAVMARLRVRDCHKKCLRMCVIDPMA